MATTKKRRKTSKARKGRRRYGRRYFVARSPAEQRWRLWEHDVDTFLHSMLSDLTVAPKVAVKRAEAFADELHAMLERRRPKDVRPSWERF